MSERVEVAVIGSGFAGSLMARVLAVLGYDVVLLERGLHPRFAIGESTTPLANLSLERIARRYSLPDCYRLAAHGRWLEHYPDLRRGLKRGFTFYRHHPGVHVDPERLASERLLVAASPNDSVADTHWLRADVDHHFVREAIAAGVDYRDRTELTHLAIDGHGGGARLAGTRRGESFDLRADFVIDASGPGGFLARQLAIPSGLKGTATRSAIVFSHFTDVRPMREAFPDFPEGPYPEDWAAVHHVIDEGWMYSLRFDDGVTSAGFVLRADSDERRASIADQGSPADMWRGLLARYPTIDASFADAKPVFPVAFRPLIQHRLTRAAGERWLLLPHAFAFVDPLFSTGIAWGLRAIERIALSFEQNKAGHRFPTMEQLARYDTMLSAEADQIDRLVAGAYQAMAHFDLFAAHAMIYFTAVSFAEARQRLLVRDADAAAWSGFVGVGDPALEALPRASLRRLRRITRGEHTAEDRRKFAEWVREAIAPRNIGGFGEPSRRHLYPVDLDWLIDRHDLFGMTRDQVIAGLPALRGMSPEPAFA
jgi:tetracycline 7-halogenase / FADH2 O2-dependent halogenase